MLFISAERSIYAVSRLPRVRGAPLHVFAERVMRRLSSSQSARCAVSRLPRVRGAPILVWTPP